MGERSYSLTH